jgi:rod shape-determining protein MreC
MRNLIQFILKHSYWLLLLIYLAAGFAMLFSYNMYHRSVYLGSSNKISGKIYAISGQVESYFNLREINTALLEKNTALEAHSLHLEEQLRHYIAENHIKDTLKNASEKKYDYITALVIKNSVSHLQNYITLNKGRMDGIEPEMGVIDHNGIVGIVTTVSDHFAVVISLLNPKLRLSAKLKRSSYFGSVVWNGKRSDYSALEELPRHVRYQKGDTLVTSGYSAVFPEGLIIGFIEEKQIVTNEEMTPIKIKLSTEFGRLGYVRVISNKLQKEQRTLEMGVQ